MLSFCLYKLGLILSPSSPGYSSLSLSFRQTASPFSKGCMHFCSITYVPHNSPISTYLTLSSETVVRSANPEASDYTVLSVLLLLLPQGLISSSAPFVPSAYVLVVITDQVSHPCKPTDTITIVHILILIFFDGRREDERICIEYLQTFPELNTPFIASYF